jgi:hypothetical protein
VTGTARIVVALIVIATMLVLMFVRKRRWNEPWWTMLGAAAMLVLGLVSPREAIDGTLAGKNALLLSLLALSLLVGKSGFFDWAAIRCARIAILSLDTTAVMLTPVMLAVVKRLCQASRVNTPAGAFSSTLRNSSAGTYRSAMARSAEEPYTIKCDRNVFRSASACSGWSYYLSRHTQQFSRIENREDHRSIPP